MFVRVFGVNFRYHPDNPLSRQLRLALRLRMLLDPEADVVVVTGKPRRVISLTA